MAKISCFRRLQVQQARQAGSPHLQREGALVAGFNLQLAQILEQVQPALDKMLTQQNLQAASTGTVNQGCSGRSTAPA
jgi:hypothetical protein